jgi:23S rRNA G2445 N2-methylase RlmL
MRVPFTKNHLATDDEIVRQLECLSEADDDYWMFRRGAARTQAHGLTQYPAMMVPSMQGILLGIVSNFDGRVNRVLDPFAGSGTIQVECMRLGLSYAGQDINPLAVLFCRTKSGPFHTSRLASAVKEVVDRVNSDRGRRVEADFPGLEKWFRSEAVIELSRIRRAIRHVAHTWSRRVLWMSLAETVRLTSNSRTSTFKLHIRSREDLRSRLVRPIDTFAAIAMDITERLHEEAVELKKAGHLSENGWYRGDVIVRLGDSAKLVPPVPGGHDLLITSPPYGDNTSTVPYGQYSYLPLQWIDLQDIDEEADPSYLQSTYEIDSRSLGGSRKNAVRDVQKLLLLSPSLNQTLRRLRKHPVDRAGRVAAFCRDLNTSLEPAVSALRPHAYMIWTVGNRRVGGAPVPTDAILVDLMAAKRVQLVTRIERRIPSKRMATRNSIATTMREETILVFRKI